MDNQIILRDDNCIIKPLDESSFSVSKYTRLGDSDLVAQISSIGQFVPEVIDAGVLSNAYSVTLPNGISGVLTEAKNGSGLIPILRDPTTGKFLGQARLHDLSGIAVYSGVMTGLSVITSQYYLKQINQKLTDIQAKMDQVLDFLYTDKLCEIYAEAQTILGIYKNYTSIIANESLCTASLATIQNARIVAEKNIQFYYRDMTKKASIDARSHSKQERIAREIREDLSGYNQAITLFSICCFLEVVLSQNYDKTYLNYMSNLISNLNTNHDIIMSKIQGRLDAITEVAGGLINNRVSSDIIELVNSLEETIGGGSPVNEFEDLFDSMIEDTTAKSEYVLLKDGSVYKKKTA